MSLNEITLTGRQVADLYATVLIDADAGAAPAATPAVKYLGKNLTNIAILVNDDHHPFLPDDELALLTNILTACKLSLADVAVVNIYNLPEATVSEAFAELQSKKVLLFGIAPFAVGLPINFPPYKTQSFNQRQYLHSAALKELNQNKELKQKLWAGLQEFFAV